MRKFTNSSLCCACYTCYTISETGFRIFLRHVGCIPHKTAPFPATTVTIGAFRREENDIVYCSKWIDLKSTDSNPFDINASSIFMSGFNLPDTCSIPNCMQIHSSVASSIVTGCGCCRLHIHPSDSDAGWNSTQHQSWRGTECSESWHAS